MLRFALDEVNRPAPNDPAAVFHNLGLAPPMWAILNDTPTPDEHAQYQDLLAEVPEQRTPPPTPPIRHTALSFEEIDHPGTAGPETCKDHYVAGSWERLACEFFGSGKWSDCVRDCLYPYVPEAWRHGHIPIDSAAFAQWALMHGPCWVGCAVAEPAQ